MERKFRQWNFHFLSLSLSLFFIATGFYRAVTRYANRVVRRQLFMDDDRLLIKMANWYEIDGGSAFIERKLRIVR